ncbi:MAG: hypothetical protein WBJ37_01020 [Bacteroidales bacterium]
MMKKYVLSFLIFVIAYLIFALLHEGCHAILSSIFNEYSSFRILPFGFQVTFKTLVEDRAGIKWAVISGVPNILTLFTGYILFHIRKNFLCFRNEIRYLFIYVVILFMIGDPFNLSIGPFIWGGDLYGITTGLSINQYILQSIFLIILLINRELIAQKLLPEFSIETKHILLRKWL